MKMSDHPAAKAALEKAKADCKAAAAIISTPNCDDEEAFHTLWTLAWRQFRDLETFRVPD